MDGVHDGTPQNGARRTIAFSAKSGLRLAILAKFDEKSRKNFPKLCDNPGNWQHHTAENQQTPSQRGNIPLKWFPEVGSYPNSEHIISR